MSFADGSMYVADLFILVDGLSVLIETAKFHVIIVVLSGQGLTKGATHSESQSFWIPVDFNVSNQNNRTDGNRLEHRRPVSSTSKSGNRLTKFSTGPLRARSSSVAAILKDFLGVASLNMWQKTFVVGHVPMWNHGAGFLLTEVEVLLICFLMFALATS